MSLTTHTDPDLNKRTKKSCEKLSENLYIIGNEPTLACYRIQEHVHKSGPMIIDKGTEMRRMTKSLQGCCHGLEYSIQGIRAMDGGRTHFENIQELLKNSLFLKQQLDYEENIRLRVKERSSTSGGGGGPGGGDGDKMSRLSAAGRAKKSAFQRFSGSFDLPSNLLTSSFGGITSSASGDLKDMSLKSVLSQLTSSGSPITRRTRSESLHTPSSSQKRFSEPPPNQSDQDDDHHQN
jgi:hypothetical protein